MIVLLFRELLAPFTKKRGGKVTKQRTAAKRLVRSGRNGSHAGVTQAVGGAKRASGDRRRATYSPGRGNLKAAKRGEQDKSSGKSELSESGRERGIVANCSNGSKASRSIAAYFCRSYAKDAPAC